MEAHDRFRAHSNTEVWHLLHLSSDSCRTLSKLVESFNCSVKASNELSHPLQDYKTIHTVLCSIYNMKEIYPNDQIYRTMKCIHNSFQPIGIKEIHEALYNQNIDDDTSSLLLDILILVLVLLYDIPGTVGNLAQLLESINLRTKQHNDVHIMDIKLMNCYLDSLFLQPQSSEPTRLPYLGHVGKLFRDTINFCQPFLIEDCNKCQLLTLVLPKLTKVMNDNENFNLIWNSILYSAKGSANIIFQLHLTADIWFPMESDNDKQSVDRAMEEALWLSLLRGLSSPAPQQRKQALYLMRRIVDFIMMHRSQSSEFAFKENLNNYILMLEALEEKDIDLMTPVFQSRWKTVIDGTFGEKNSPSGLPIPWIPCALTRILNHENDAVVKWGLSYVFTLNIELYDYHFLIDVLCTLDNISMYEIEGNNREPIVVKGLTRFLNYIETQNSDFISEFIVTASQIMWKSSVSVYYVIHALFMVNRVRSVWSKVELEAIQLLAKSNATIHSPVLRIALQIELLETVTNFTVESLDLTVIANMLSVFSTNEALIRGQPAWKLTSDWLSKIVKREEALNFIKNICQQMMSEDSHKDLNVKSFSLIIMLLYDGQVILDSKACSGFDSLCDLLNCLIGADSRPYVSAELRNTSIELIHHIVDFMSSKDHILQELISNYANASLGFTFTALRKISDETLCDRINTYILVTQQLFSAESTIISKREALNHIEKFEVESCNIIEDGKDSNNAQRFFGIKILHACIKAMSMKLRNYRFIGPLYKTYKIPMTQASKDSDEASKKQNDNAKLTEKIAEEYYKTVAELFHEYLENESADDFISNINWIEQVSYLIQVGGSDIFVPAVEILSQIFCKGAVKATDIDDFKTAIRSCWNITLEFNGGLPAIEKIMNLIFSIPFLECEETKELTIEIARDVVEQGGQIPELSVILLKGLKQVKGEYLGNFHEAILASLLYRITPCYEKRIELSAQSLVLDCYEDAYPNYFANIIVNANAVIRAHAFTLLHKMIADDPAHAGQLLKLITARLDKSQAELLSENSETHHSQGRILQVLLILQPILENDDIKTLHQLIYNSILSETTQPFVRSMQEWILARIYLENDALREKIWDLIDQGQQKCVFSISSVISVMYHVARLLSPNMQLDFINLAFQYITPCCMAREMNVSLYARVTVSKLYDLAAEMSYLTVTEKYRELCCAMTRSLNYEYQRENSVGMKDDSYLSIVDPIEDYSLEALFYELPRLCKDSLDECISPQTFEKFGFKESNRHPLKLLNLKSNASKLPTSTNS